MEYWRGDRTRCARISSLDGSPARTAGRTPAGGPLRVSRLVARRSQGAARGTLATGAVRCGSRVGSAGVWLDAAAARRDRVVSLSAAFPPPPGGFFSGAGVSRLSARLDDGPGGGGHFFFGGAD